MDLVLISGRGYPPAARGGLVGVPRQALTKWLPFRSVFVTARETFMKANGAVRGRGKGKESYKCLPVTTIVESS